MREVEDDPLGKWKGEEAQVYTIKSTYRSLHNTTIREDDYLFNII